jgi:hypothetical protein
MKTICAFFSALLFSTFLQAQTNIISTNPEAAQVMKGNYDPSAYTLPPVINDKTQIVNGINSLISNDSLHSYLKKLGSFYNRNTGSDTVSGTRGVGAARRWVFDMFLQYSSQNQGRLLCSYLQFDQNICNITQHRNIFAVLPGSDTAEKDITIIEAHMDSRCEDGCDTSCLAQGIEDNASGTALVMELARVMSKYTFKRTIVFLVTIGEEQGLYGANAFAQYVTDNAIEVRGVQNNDVIGGIICGYTSSPPSCPGPNDIDSLNVRIFSAGNYASTPKAYARFSKVEYIDELLPIVSVPTNIRIMTPEDRTGRGGDHIPFRQKGYRSVRFSSANENGSGDIGPGYTDRQHSVRDVLGKDLNSDGILDSFYVDFNYLKRNAVINGVAAAMSASGPVVPAFNIVNNSSGLSVQLTSALPETKYRVSVRRDAANYDLDLLFAFADTTAFRIPFVKKDSTYFVSIASIDDNGVESIFTVEKTAKALGDGPVTTSIPEQLKEEFTSFKLLDAVPNPFRGSTSLFVKMGECDPSTKISIRVFDIIGRQIQELTVNPVNGEISEVFYDHQDRGYGIYTYTLVLNGNMIDSKKFLVTK